MALWLGSSWEKFMRVSLDMTTDSQELLSTKEKVMIEILNVLVTKKIHVCIVALV